VSNTSDILFEYLREVFYNPSKAKLDIEQLDEDFVLLGKGLLYFAECFAQYNELAIGLAKGDLSISLPPPENELAAPLKTLHASLRHLTWQSQQVAKGDYKQRVDFMGDFSNAFNMMIIQLSERQQKLENEIDASQKKTMALEQSNKLLSNITQNIPQQIIVIDKKTSEILFMNSPAQNEINLDDAYLERLLALMAEHHDSDAKYNVEIQYPARDSGTARYLSVSSYSLQWQSSSAEAFVINDISTEKNQIKELEAYAFRDTMTHLHNRFSGMLTLNMWLEEHRQFTLVFVDLDNLKYINDKYGHSEGDNYIIITSKHLRTISSDAIVCRIGGDEFMLLFPGINYDEAVSRMENLYQTLKSDEYLDGKRFSYSISYGVVSIDEGNTLQSSDILSLADSRMYKNKRTKKKDWPTDKDLNDIYGE